MRRHEALIVMILLSIARSLSAQVVTVFKGRPTVAISEGGVSRTPVQLPRDAAISREVVLSQIGGKYYWASRENKELTRIDPHTALGAFITFVALDGSGYVRITIPENKAMASLMGETEAKFDYVEHLLIGLRSVTYYGQGDASKLPTVPDPPVRSTVSATCAGLARASVVAEDGTFLGRLTNKFESQSILNTSGSYGSAYSSTSMYNTFDRYGSPYSSHSAFNPYASTPPIVGGGVYVTKNTFKTPGIDPDALRKCNFP